jgi:hypothetical protein
MLIDDARQILAVWRERLLADEDVRAWSWRMIERTSADDLPEWLLDLAAQGPWKCLSRPSSEFIDVPFLEFVVGFSLRVQTTDFANPAEVDEFVLWTARACMGQTRNSPRWGSATSSTISGTIVIDRIGLVNWCETSCRICGHTSRPYRPSSWNSWLLQRRGEQSS